MSIKGFHNRLFALNRQLEVGHARREYLDEKYFFLTILATLFLHMGAMYIWNLVPATQVVDIPISALNIKLGDGEDAAPVEIKAAQPNKDDVENAISKMVQPQELDKQVPAKADSASKDQTDKTASDPTLVQESARKSGVAKQFVRSNAVQASSKTGGSTAGNSSAKDAEIMSRYEQLISLWIEKFKLYPEDARAQGMQGETVVRIRIDRQGNIRYYILERSTGLPLLDQAAIDMIKRANPVPAVPTDYPKADLIEFLIPVNFHLQ